MRIRFWGVRGSIACPGPETAIFGGNTACIELRFGSSDRLLIIDSGTGIRPLGNYLVQNDLLNGAVNAEIFYTHTHWDHIIGFPFFEPIYIPETKLKVYGPITFEEDTLEKIIGDLLRYRYFPVMYSELAADITYYQLGECEMDLGDGISLKTKYLNHPLLCLGYRFEFNDKVLCTAYDTEPFRGLFATDETSSEYQQMADEISIEAATEKNEKLIDFYRGADVLIHDAQYTQEEYFSSKTGWGHSFFEYAIASAAEAAVKKVVLFHHDPSRTDDELLKLEKQYERLNKTQSPLEIIIAREGMELKL